LDPVNRFLQSCHLDGNIDGQQQQVNLLWYNNSEFGYEYKKVLLLVAELNGNFYVDGQQALLILCAQNNFLD